jgi:hypothetical protein
MARKQDADIKYTQADKDATRLVAEKIKAAGFNVFSHGYIAVVVIHDNGNRSTMVRAENVDEFIKTAAR